MLPAIRQTSRTICLSSDSPSPTTLLHQPFLNGIVISAPGTEVNENFQPGSGSDFWTLLPSYPNPFNPTTQIRFTIANRELTIVKVYDLLGREVATLLNEVKEPGRYTVQFDGSNLSSGVYFYQLRAGTSSR
jgi:hypothetical protein